MNRLLPVLFLAAAACRSASPAAAPPQAPAPAASPVATVTPAPAASPDLPENIRWVLRSAEYRADFLQTYRLATEHVERAAQGRAAGTWGVMADADETVISNVQYEIERWRTRTPHSRERWAEWVGRKAAAPLPGAGAFLRRVRELGGRIAIVTNRYQAECPDTEAVFQGHGLAYDVMLCRPDGGPSDKNPRFERVRTGEAFGSGPVELLAVLGDNIQDFPGQTQELRKKGDEAFADFGGRLFVLPNPLYGSWEGNPD
jgi:5'-nucleotidase (lipoprotein e(P4) family)